MSRKVLVWLGQLAIPVLAVICGVKWKPSRRWEFLGLAGGLISYDWEKDIPESVVVMQP